MQVHTLTFAGTGQHASRSPLCTNKKQYAGASAKQTPPPPPTSPSSSEKATPHWQAKADQKRRERKW